VLADPILSRELKSLQDEVAASQRARTQSPPDRPIASDAGAVSDGAAVSASQPEEVDEEQKLRGELRELVDEATKFYWSPPPGAQVGIDTPIGVGEMTGGSLNKLLALLVALALACGVAAGVTVKLAPPYSGDPGDGY